MIINNMAFLAVITSVASAVFAQYFIKKLTAVESISRALNIMFFLCAGLALVIGLMFGSALQVNIFLVGLGFFNALVAWLFWRAIKISLSQTMLFIPLTGFTAVLLSAVFLGEWILLNPQHFSGLLVMFGVLGLLSSIYFFRGASKEDKRIKKIWLWCIIGQSILGGVIFFLIKYVALREIPKTNFLFSWYLGALLGSVALLAFDRSKKMVRSRSMKVWLFYVLMSVGALISVLANYWSLEMAPATLVLPPQQFLNVLGSVLVGLFIFNERKKFSFLDWIGVAVGFTSMILLIGGITLIG